jgi:hypothetical protein
MNAHLHGLVQAHTRKWRCLTGSICTTNVLIVLQTSIKYVKLFKYYLQRNNEYRGVVAAHFLPFIVSDVKSELNRVTVALATSGVMWLKYGFLEILKIC